MSQHLKRVKKQNALKAELYKEIADFLIELKMASTIDRDQELKRILAEGWDSLYEMSNKELVEILEEGMINLKDAKFKVEFYDDDRDRYDDRRDWENEQQETRQNFIGRGSLLMDKLMERALGLEAEDVRRHETGQINKRRLVDESTKSTSGDF